MLREIFPKKEIQGLHNKKTAQEEYWLLLARVTLSNFREKPSLKQLETVTFSRDKNKGEKKS